MTLPGIRKGVGRRHPLMQTMEAVKAVLQGMGFRYDDYPEVETEYHNFDSLNTPKWHPSRDMHDSFYTKAGGVVRTHTTAFQVRAMRHQKTPPIRAMTSGRCYRRDEIDATHFPIFNQLDVIAIDQAISFADLKWTLDRLIRALLGQDVKLRFRPSFFPFTTPSAEVDVFYRGRWMELLGSGMIRPEVLRNGGLDPDRYQGFAFGMGIDRLTMARYGIDDIRLLYANEESFLAQFLRSSELFDADDCQHSVAPGIPRAEVLARGPARCLSSPRPGGRANPRAEEGARLDTDRFRSAERARGRCAGISPLRDRAGAGPGDPGGLCVGARNPARAGAFRWLPPARSWPRGGRSRRRRSMEFGRKE